jgi:hypothetical protein
MAVKAAEQNVKDTFRAHNNVNSKYAQMSIGGYVYQYDGENGYRFDLKANPMAALGFDVDSAPFSSYSSPNSKGSWFSKGRQVTDWFIAVSPNDNISLNQTFHRAVELGVNSVYRWSPQNNTTLHYTYDTSKNSWSCSVYSGGGSC